MTNDRNSERCSDRLDPVGGRFRAFMKQLGSPWLDPVAQHKLSEVERLREVVAQMDSEWVDPVEVERLREQIAWMVARCNEAMGGGFSGTPNSAVAAVCDELHRLRGIA